MNKKEKREKKILWISFSAGAVFAVVEFLYAIFSHSQSVLMDAVYDTTELIFIALILFLTPLFYKPVSEKHPYGYFQLESIFLIIKGFMMLSVTFGVSAEVIQSALSGGNPVDESQISLFQFVLGTVSVLIYYLLKGMNHSLNSPTINAEILEWKLDIAYSLGLSLAFFASSYLSKTALAPLAPYVDPIIAVAVMLLMLPENISMLTGAIRDVFLFSPDDEMLENIRRISAEIMEEHRITPVFIDITRTGRHMWVGVYFETSKSTLSVSGLTQLTNTISREVNKAYPNTSCELIISPSEEVDKIATPEEEPVRVEPLES